MKKVINITEEELTKIVKRAINENEESTFELFGRMIQRMDDFIESMKSNNYVFGTFSDFLLTIKQ